MTQPARLALNPLGAGTSDQNTPSNEIVICLAPTVDDLFLKTINPLISYLSYEFPLDDEAVDGNPNIIKPGPIMIGSSGFIRATPVNNTNSFFHIEVARITVPADSNERDTLEQTLQRLIDNEKSALGKLSHALIHGKQPAKQIQLSELDGSLNNIVGRVSQIRADINPQSAEWIAAAEAVTGYLERHHLQPRLWSEHFLKPHMLLLSAPKVEFEQTNFPHHFMEPISTTALTCRIAVTRPNAPVIGCDGPSIRKVLSW